jgi:hypothetical protein
MDLDTDPRTNLYYYQGNFYHPVDVSGRILGQVRGGIRKFMREHKALFEHDRRQPDYKTLVQLFEEQFPGE